MLLSSATPKFPSSVNHNKNANKMNGCKNMP
jgi:hypothetical protein